MIAFLRNRVRFLDTSDLDDGVIFLRLRRTVSARPRVNQYPTYLFDICQKSDGVAVGRCDLRLGHNTFLYYSGNIGYRVYESFRGHHYAAHASRLLFSLARRHNMDWLIITCNPDNLPSRRTCELLGGELLEIADVPADHELYELGERQKCIFRYDLSQPAFR